MERAKAENLIQLIQLLSTRNKTRNDLAKILNVQIRQINRYFDVLEDLGLAVDQDMDGKCFIFGAEKILKNQLEYYEMAWLKNLIMVHDLHHPFSESVLQKLSQHSVPFIFPNQIAASRRSFNYERLMKAIERKERIILVKYISPMNPQPPRDRLVEPIEFDYRHRSLIAYEIASKSIKTFKLDRVHSIELTGVNCKYKSQKKVLMDAFGFSGTRFKIIELELSSLAKEVLFEKYAESRTYISKSKNRYFFRGPVCHYAGVAGFVLSLPQQIRVIKDEGLRTYLNEQVAKMKF